VLSNSDSVEILGRRRRVLPIRRTKPQQVGCGREGAELTKDTFGETSVSAMTYHGARR